MQHATTIAEWLFYVTRGAKMQEIERVEHDDVGGLVVEGLKRRASVRIQRDEFAVQEDRSPSNQRDRLCHGGVLRGGVAEIPREQAHTSVLLVRERAIAVPLHFVGPVTAGWED